MEYENGKPVKVKSIVISTQHSPKVNQKVKEIVRPYLEKSIQKTTSRIKRWRILCKSTGQL